MAIKTDPSVGAAGLSPTLQPTGRPEVLSLIDSIDTGLFETGTNTGVVGPTGTSTAGNSGVAPPAADGFEERPAAHELGRLNRQDGRISRNHDSNHLTDKEHRKLERQQMKVGNAVIAALSDGKIDAAEQAKIDKLQDKANLSIYKESHDKQGKGGRFEERSKRQTERINNGVKSGALTKGEEKRLENTQKKIDKATEKARADGKITEAEAKKLDRLQDRASHQIYAQKHDKQTRSK